LHHQNWQAAIIELLSNVSWALYDMKYKQEKEKERMYAGSENPLPTLIKEEEPL